MKLIVIKVENTSYSKLWISLQCLPSVGGFIVPALIFSDNFLRTLKSWTTRVNALTFSSESKFWMKVSSRSPTSLFTLQIYKIRPQLLSPLQILQGLVIWLKFAGLCPQAAMTGIVECTNKTLCEWQKSCWRHHFLLEITWI